MSEWKEIFLGQCISVSSGEGLPESKMNPGQYIVYGGNGVAGFHNEFLFEKEQLIIGRVGAHCGNIHITKAKSWITDNALIVSFIENDNDLLFWYYLLRNLNLRENAFQSAQPVITGGIISKIKVKTPPISAQRKISQILSTADAVIEKTQAAIAKYKAIKQGMLHDLFTRGIDIKTSKLRPRYEDAPELYKPSSLGFIPVEWEVERLEDSEIEIIDGDRGVNYPKENDFSESGFCLFLSASNVSKDGFKFENKQFITKEKDDLLGTGKLKKEDIVVTTRGTVGNVVYYGNTVTYNHVRINSGMIILRNLGNKIYNEFLYHFVKEFLFEIQYKKSMSGSAQPQLPIKDFKKIPTVYPNEKEQTAISERLNALNNKLHTEQAYLHKLQQLKAGLMGDLLSGRVKVSESQMEGI